MNWRLFFWLSLVLNMILIGIFVLGYIELNKENEYLKIKESLESICMYHACEEYDYYDTIMSEGMCVCFNDEMKVMKKEVFVDYIYKR